MCVSATPKNDAMESPSRTTHSMMMGKKIRLSVVLKFFHCWQNIRGVPSVSIATPSRPSSFKPLTTSSAPRGKGGRDVGGGGA